MTQAVDDTIKTLEAELASVGNDQQKLKCYQLLANAHKQVGNFEAALYHYEQLYSIIKNQNSEQYVAKNVQNVHPETVESQQIEPEWKSLLASEQEQRLLAETLQEVTLALASQIGTEAVLDEILRQVQRLVPYNTANIMLLDGDMLHTVRWQGYEAFGSEQFLSTLSQPLANFPLDSQVIQSQTPLIVDNTDQEPLWVVFDETAWIKSNMVIPICLRERILGVLRLDADTTGRFSKQDVEHLMPLVHASAIALENARLFDRVQTELNERIQAEAQLKQSYRELMALNAVSTAVSQSRGLNETLMAILDKVLDVVLVESEQETESDLVPNRMAGCINLLDEDNKNLSLAVYRGLPKNVVAAMSTIQMDAHQSHLPVWDNPALSKEEAEMLPGDLADYLSAQIEGLEIARRAGWQFLVNVPLQFEDKVLGLLTIFVNDTSESMASVGRYTPHPAGKLVLRQLQLLRAIGQQVGVAIENERLTKEAAEVKVSKEVNYLRSELIANISHELRTPLGLIKAASTTLLAEDVEFDQQTKRMLLQGLDEETDKLESLVNNLLNLSSLDQKGALLQYVPTDIGQLAKKVTKSMQTQNTTHQFVHHFPNKPLIANIDAGRIEQVLRNLLVNAEKYSPNGGTITIEGREENRQIFISVIDQGIGILPGDLQKIFERFYRVSNNTTLSVRGVGLGLAISQEIIDAHGGHIWAESTPGKGSTFHISLPVD